MSRTTDLDTLSSFSEILAHEDLGGQTKLGRLAREILVNILVSEVLDAANIAASSSAQIFDSVSEGLAATPSGGFFFVAAPDSNSVLTLYRDNAGAASARGSIANDTVVAALSSKVADLLSQSTVTLTVTSSGPANAIVATSPAGDGAASNIVFLGIPAVDTNTIASDVAPTLQVDGDIARVIRDRNGDLLDPGDVRGSMLLKRVTGQWRMLTDPGRTRLSGAFSNDAEAAANGVPLKESYRRTDGLVAWRQN